MRLNLCVAGKVGYYTQYILKWYQASSPLPLSYELLRTRRPSQARDDEPWP